MPDRCIGVSRDAKHDCRRQKFAAHRKPDSDVSLLQFIEIVIRRQQAENVHPSKLQHNDNENTNHNIDGDQSAHPLNLAIAKS